MSGSPLPRRTLGSNGPEITTVGFGAWAAGGGGWSFAWGAQDDAASIAAIRYAVSRGVSWIDTAAVYGLGHSEEVVGRAIAAIPRAERPLVFTKCGLRWNPKDPMEVSARDSSPARIRQECEDSLRRLGVEAIDLYQFHWPDQSGTPLADSWGEMMRLRDAGKVRYVGVSNYTTTLLEACEALGHVQSLQPPFSLLRRDLAATELPWCQAHGTGVIVYSPMQSGLLTDGFSAARVEAMPADDWRRRAPHFQQPNLERNLSLRDALLPLAKKRGVNVGALAVAWTLAWPGVTGAIVGARGPEQVDGWIAGASLALDASALQEIARAIERTGAGSGPLRPA
jgi:aryl-alcohol dehydrogenase-like predicted oxidoreductase